MLWSIVTNEAASACDLSLVCDKVWGGGSKARIGNKLEWDLCMEECEG